MACKGGCSEEQAAVVVDYSKEFEAFPDIDILTNYLEFSKFGYLR
jgi:hypothetical protein